VLVDYYGFNIHIGKKAKELGIDVYYYISPQVWASRKKRIAKIARVVKKMLVILPFEEKLYRKHGIDAEFVGHPLIDMVPEPVISDSSTNAKPVIGLFPGSRKHVFDKHLPILLESARLIQKELDCDFKLFVAYENLLKNKTVPYEVVKEKGYAKRRELSFAITTSGMVSLETALLGIPMAIMYKLSSFNYFLARLLVKVPYIGMANILLNSEIVPELIQKKAEPAVISKKVIEILRNKNALNTMKENLLALRKMLGKPGVSARAAKIILGK
jgi:lipid-A-disaccharide synthase